MKLKVLEFIKVLVYCLGYMMFKAVCIIGGFVMTAASMFIVCVHYAPEHFGLECRFCGARLFAVCLYGFISFIICVASIVSLSNVDEPESNSNNNRLV